MLEIFNSLLFLLIGYLLGRLHTNEKIIQETIKQVKKQDTPKPGIIDYPTQEEIDYRESGEEKVDEARKKLFEVFFKPIDHA